MVFWRAESIKGKSYLVGVDEHGGEHYYPVKTRVDAQRAERIFNEAGVRGIQGDPGLTREQVWS